MSTFSSFLKRYLDMTGDDRSALTWAHIYVSWPCALFPKPMIHIRGVAFISKQKASRFGFPHLQQYGR